MSLLHAVIILPLLFSAAMPLLHKLTPRIHTGWYVLPLPALIFLYFAGRVGTIRNGEHVLSTVPWIPSLDVNFTVYLDGLSLLFGLLISGIGSLVVLYSVYYMDKEKEAVGKFYVYLLLFMGAMLGVVLSDNLIALYGFWEMTSLASFLLIAFWHHKERSLYGALKSLLITVFGGLAMLAGFVLLYVMSDTFSVREILSGREAITENSLFIPSMVLILLGAFTKSVQFPFHIWLPDAMEAPTPVSAYLHSATMVKAGIYLAARLSPVYAGEAGWFWLVSAAGIVTLIYGSFRAMKQTDLKALLAYSTISQLGLVMSLLGLGSAAAIYFGKGEGLFYAKATAAAIFHLINHAIFKGALFMAVGIVDHETGTRDIRRLGGLMAVMPVTFTVSAIGAFSMAGLPPFGGFLSKEMFFTAVLGIIEMDVFNMQFLGVWFPIVAWVASLFTFAYSMLLVFRTFAGEKRFDKLAKQPHEAPLGMLLPPVVLASLAVVFGLFPNLLSYTLIAPAMAAIHPAMLQSGQRFDAHIQLWHGWTPEVFMTIGVISVGTVIYRMHGRVKPLHRPLFSGISLNGVYDGGLKLLHGGGKRLTDSYMTGSVRHYLIYIFAFLIVSVGAAIGYSGDVRFDFSGFAPMSLYEAVIILALAAAVIAVPFTRSRMTAIILTGTVGYIVTFFFVIFRAPDLALTQMIVETVSVALFLLCFYHLPKLKKDPEPLRFRLPNFIIALGVGAVMTLVALLASGSRSFESISDFFVKESYELAGGKNIVNVILVDFRGFDTLLEITVLGIASYGIYALIRLKAKEEEPLLRSRMETGSPLSLQRTHSNDVILRTIAKLAVFIILTFSLFSYFSGHNAPGGGFIGGLMTAAAFVLLAMAFGMKTFKEAVPLDFRIVTAAGLLIALLTGIGSFFFGAPFLSHAFGYFDLPLLGHSELATAMLFDLGVYLTVVGIAMTIILAIGRDK